VETVERMGVEVARTLALLGVTAPGELNPAYLVGA
jgi:hypothetical protein